MSNGQRLLTVPNQRSTNMADEEEQLDIDPTAICRCCLAEHEALRPIISKEIVNGSIVSFRSLFESVTGFKVTSLQFCTHTHNVFAIRL